MGFRFSFDRLQSDGSSHVRLTISNRQTASTCIAMAPARGVGVGLSSSGEHGSVLSLCGIVGDAHSTARLDLYQGCNGVARSLQRGPRHEVPESWRQRSSRHARRLPATRTERWTSSWEEKPGGGARGGLPLPPPAPYVRPRRKISSSCCSLCHCLWCIVSVLIILIILAGITVLAIYIIFLPKLPKYSLLDVAVTRLSVTNRAGGPISSLADLQNPVLNADIAFTILVENPNEKLGIHYKDMSVFVFYQGTQFAHSFIAPFYQRCNSSSQVVIDMTATSAPLSERQGKELQAALSQNDVPLLARINVGAALEIRSWVLPPGHVHIVCDLRISPPTAPHGTKLLSKSCKWLH